VKLAIQTFILTATSLLSFFAMAAKTHKDPFPPLPEATLVYGSIDPFFLVVRTPGATLRVLPESEQPPHDYKSIHPSITLDGQQVAAARLRGGNPRQVSISVYSIPEKKWTDYAVGTYAGSIAISPDGLKLAFPGQCTYQPVRIHVVNRTTGEETLGPDVIDCNAKLSWSPDAKQLVFEAGSPDVPIKTWDLHSNRVKKLVTGVAPAWSPSGEWIAYFSGGKAKVMHPDGTGEKTIAELPGAGFIIGRQLEFRELPVWSPDSAHLLLNVLMTEEYGMDMLMVDLPSLHKKTVFKNVTPIMGWAEVR
jgi:Tol biopolymer transport system component